MPEWKPISSRRRDKLSIIAEILDAAREGTLKTQIMYKANLSFSQLNDYLKFMMKRGLLNRFRVKGKEVYVATEKGLDFLQCHNELSELLRFPSDKNEEYGEKIVGKVTEPAK